MKDGLLVWICIAIAGAMGLVGLVLGSYNTFQTQSGSGTINVRSATVNGQSTTTSGGSLGSAAVTTTLIQSGTYDIRVNYVNPAAPFTGLQDQQTVGTYTLSSVQIQGDTAKRIVVQLSAMTYTFSAIPNAQNAQFSFVNFTGGGMPVSNFGMSPLTNTYTVTSSVSGTFTYKTITASTQQSDPNTFSIVFYPRTESAMTAGSTFTTNTPIKFTLGTQEI
jgi:hypothetical protein